MVRRDRLWIGRTLLAILGLLVLLLVSLLIFRPTLNLELLRPRIESGLSEQIGVPVSIGDVRLRTSLWPTLFVRNLRVATTDAQGTSDIARVEGVEAQIALLPLLRQRLSIDKVRIEALEIHLQPALALLDQDQPASAGRPDWALVGLRELEGDDIVVRDHGAGAQRYELNLAAISGGVSPTQPFELEVVGKLNEQPLKIDLDGPPIANLFDPPAGLSLTALLEIGDLVASTQVAMSHSSILLDDLQGQLDSSPFSGELKMAFSSERPSLSGKLALARLRADWWRPKGDLDSDPIASPGASSDLWAALSAVEVPYDLLELVNADLKLSLDRVEGLALEMDRLRARLALREGQLDLPIQLALAGAPVEATVKVEPRESEQKISLKAILVDFPLDRLAAVSDDLAPLSGRIDDLRVSATTSGQSLGDLLNQASVDLQSTNLTVCFSASDAERELGLDIAQISVKRRPEERLRIELRGAFQEQPFHLGLRSKNLLELELGKPWPIELTLQSLSIDTRIAATLTPTDTLPVIDTAFRFTGKRLSDLSRWLGISNNLELAFALSGRYYFGRTKAGLTITEGRLGRSSFSADVRHNTISDGALQVDIAVAAIDLQELEALAQPLEERELSEKRLRLDLPVLPKPLALPNTDLHLMVERIVREPEDITDVVVALRFREGRLEPSTLSFRAGTTEIAGTAQLFWDQEVPHIEIDLAGKQIDLADLFETERIGAQLTASAEHLELSFKSQGATLRHLLLLNSHIELSGRGLAAEMPFGETDRKVALSLNRLQVDAPENQPLTAQASGQLNGRAVQLTMQANPEEDYTLGDNLLIDLVARFDDVKTQLRGAIDFPLDLDEQQLELLVSAPMISSLNPILALDMPNLGPLRFAGSLNPQTTGFEVRVNELVVGASRLSGTIAFDRTGQRPRAEAQLTAAKLRPEDFLSADWRPETNSDRDASDPAAPTSPEHETASQPLRFPRDLEMLRRIDGTLALRVDELTWGEMTGGGGELQAQLANGRLTITPLRLEQHNSAVALQADLLIRDWGLDADLRLRIDDFRYGPIAQSLIPEAERDGTVTVDAALRAEGATLGELLSSGSGHFHFTLHPRSVDTRVFDLWAAGLRSVIGVFNPNEQSVLNCIAGRFAIDDGLMKTDNLLLDTSQIRAQGSGAIALTDGTVQMRFQPRPKRRTFVNLATPLQVSGPLNAPNIRVTVGGFAGTLLRIFTWAVTAFLELFRTPLPSDGADVCIAPARKVETRPGL